MPKRSAHPGVYLLRPRDEHRAWRARWHDPDTLRTVYRRLPATVKTAEGRRAWAIDQSRRLVARRLELEAGAQPAEPHAISSALKTYFDAHEHLRPRTLIVYRAAAKKFEAWATRARVDRTTELTRGKLLTFRESVVNEKRRAPVEGGKRGEYAATKLTRAPAAVNAELRAIRTIIGYWLDRDMLRVSERDLKRALRSMPLPQERIEFYDRAAIAKLPVRDAFVRFVLLTGMRLGEAIDLEWDQVVDDEIHISATSKTHRARTVDLSVCPTVTAMLKRMRDARDKRQKRKDAKPEPRVWTDVTRGSAAGQSKRDGFSWQALRRTCGTFLTNAPGIFGAASAYRSARQLGHSVAVAEKHYLGVVKVPTDAKTLEASMGIEGTRRV